jgi:hypothetical protein
MLTKSVFLERPTSPSGKMAALSRQFTGRANVEVHIGTPPREDRKMQLSRKVQSELNLTKLGRTETSQSVAGSVTSGFSGSSGDPLPDEISTPSALTDTTVECEAFAALRELGALVARRRGINADVFLDGLSKLLSDAQRHGPEAEVAEIARGPLQPKLVEEDQSSKLSYVDGMTTPSRTLRRFQSQPQLSSIYQHRRNFSFDPGQDQLEALQEDLTHVASKPSYGDTSTSDTSVGMREPQARPPLRGMKSSSQVSVSSLESNKTSKIPSPSLPCGRVRRENSTSSLQSVFTRLNDERRNSQTSVLTAFRETPAGNLRKDSNSRSSSFRNLRNTEVSSSLTDHTGSVRKRNSVAAIAVARAAEQANQVTTPKAVSPGKNTAGSSLRKHVIMGSPQSENDKLSLHGEAVSERNSPNCSQSRADSRI